MGDVERDRVVRAIGVLTLENMALSPLTLSEGMILEFVEKGIQEYTDLCGGVGVRFVAFPGLAMEVRDSIVRYLDMKAQVC